MQYSMTELQEYLNQLYGNQRMLLTSWGYTLTFATLAAGGVSTQPLLTQANGDFLLTGINYHAAIAGGAQTVSSKTIALCRMLITDSGSNEQFTQQAVDLENYCSNDAKMRFMPWPRLVQGRSALSVQMTNYSAGDTYSTIDVFFSGVQIRILN